MKRGILYLLFVVMLLQTSGAHAQGELWGVSPDRIFKVDANNPAPANAAVVHSFTTSGLGNNPEYSPKDGGNGKLYGTTNSGGAFNKGVLYEYDPTTSTYTKKIDLNGTDGYVGGPITLAPNGKFYGTTLFGGTSNNGVLFEYDPATNSYSKKFDFDGAGSGGIASGELTLASNGKFYGMTQQGGAFDGGVLYEYDPAITNGYTKKIDFNGTASGYYLKDSHLALAPNGKFYGVTYNGGTSNQGTLFEYDPATNQLTKKYDFSSASGGAYHPYSGLTLAPNGKFYGATDYGGTEDYGAIFEYDYVTNNFAVTHNLLPEDAGSIKVNLMLAPNGKLYGTTQEVGGAGDNGYGALFEYNPATSTFTKKIQFDGFPPLSGFVSDKLLYVGMPQTITSFAAIPDKTYGDAPFTVSATGGASGNPVVFTSSNPAVATVSGNTVTIVGGGTVTITAKQAGTSTYFSAGASQTFTVNKVGQSITFGSLANKTLGDAPFALTGTASSGLPVTYTSSNTAVATISGSTITIVGAGTSTITASQPGDTNYLVAPDVPQTLTVKLPQSISFSALTVRTMGDAPFALSATGGGSGNPVTFVSSNTSVATILGNVVTVVGAGTTTITASQAGNVSYSAAPDVPQTLTVNKGNQSITFGTLSTKTFGDAAFGLIATTSSGLPVSYASSNTSVATISGSTVTIVGAGTTTITASQAGNASFNAATSVPQTLTINKANQSITFGVIPVKALGDANFTLSAASTSGLAVSYASSNTSVATVSGNTVTIVGSGTATITASQPGNTNYNAATDVQQTLVVSTGSTKTDQTITFNALTNKVVGDAAFNLTATTTSGLTISYISSNTSVATVSGNTVTIVGAGTTIITASQAGNATFNAAVPVSQGLTVTKLNQTITFNALSDRTMGDAAFTLSATASSGLPVSYTSSSTSMATVSGNTVTIVGAGTTIIATSQSGNASYNAASSVTRTLTINKQGQNITFGTLPSKFMGDAPFNLTATATSSLPVSYVCNNPAVATISGSIVTIVGVGTAIITAVQHGNATFEQAIPVYQYLSVFKANQTISFSQPATKLVTDVPFNLTATATSGLAVSYTSSNPSVATVSGNTVTILASGNTTITALQEGNANYAAANSVPRNLTVAKVSQTITFNALADKTCGDAIFSLTATASSGLPVSYTSSNTSVATISGNTVTILNSGGTNITASHFGNSTYNSAAPVTQLLTVTKGNQTIAFNPLANKTVGDVPFTLTGTASSGLDVNYVSGNIGVATISGNKVTIVGAGTADIYASHPGNSCYNATTNTIQPLTVNKATQTITFDHIHDQIFGDDPLMLEATGGPSGNPITYTSSDPAVATTVGNALILRGAGDVTITASQEGNHNYQDALPVEQTITVEKGFQWIDFAALAEQRVGDANFNLTATASSGLPVSFTSSDESVATVSGNTVTIVGAGVTWITALQSGNANFNEALQIPQPLIVNKSNQTITFNALAAKTFGDAAFTLPATATSGLPVSYASSNTSVATISGNTVTIVGAGTTTITASQGGNLNYNSATSVPQSLTVNKSNQAITFNTLAAKTVGDAAFTLSATASSGLAISYSSSNTSVATVSGNTVTIVGGGTTIITASQSGNANFNAAASVTQTLSVNKSSQTITFSTHADKNVGDANFNLSATASSALTVSYTSSNTSVATVSGNTVTIVGAGTTIITASQSGNASFSAAVPVTQSLTVNKSNQSITFNTLTDKNVGDAAFNLSANANSGLTVSYSSSNTAVATVSGNMVTIAGAGTTIITASQTGNGSFNAATPVSQTLTVNKTGQTITFNVLANKVVGDPALPLIATASSGLPVTYISSNPSVATISGSTVTIVGAGTTIITGSQSGNASYYAAASVSQPLTVTAGSKADQTISFTALSDKVFGDANFNLAATTSSGLPVSYESSNESVATISGNTVTILSAGITIITAAQSGNTSYNAAIEVPRTLTVNKTTQTVTFNALENKTFGDPAFTLTATASSGLPVSYESSNPSVAVASGNTITILSAGTSVITAYQSGHTNYNASDNVLQTLTVNKKDQAITFPSLIDKTVDDVAFNLTATANSGLPVHYESSNHSVATVSGSLVTIVGAGTAVIIASQSGNGNYNSAMDAQQTLTVLTAKTNQTITFNTLADKTIGDDAFDLTATATSGLLVSYVSSNTSVATISGSTVTITGTGTTMITASQSGNTTYNGAVAVSRTLTVTKKDQTISFSSLADKTVGDAAFNLTATASSGLAVSYSSTSDKVIITGGSVNVVKPGRATIIASQSGNAGYNAAAPISQGFCIQPAKPAITVMSADTESPKLTSSALEGNQWYLNDVAIEGATNSTLHATQPGVYKVQVKVDDCVSDFSDSQPLIVTGNVESYDDMKVEVYPNPVSDWLHISLGNLQGKKDITIFHMNGREKTSQEVDGNEARFQVDDYSSGVYVVKVTSGNKVRLLRFLKY